MQFSQKNRSWFRLIVSAYLVYLGTNIIRSGSAEGGGALPGVFGGLFILVGVGYAVFALKILKRAVDEEKAANRNEREADRKEETADGNEREAGDRSF